MHHTTELKQSQRPNSFLAPAAGCRNGRRSSCRPKNPWKWLVDQIILIIHEGNDNSKSVLMAHPLDALLTRLLRAMIAWQCVLDWQCHQREMRPTTSTASTEPTTNRWSVSRSTMWHNKTPPIKNNSNCYDGKTSGASLVWIKLRASRALFASHLQKAEPTSGRDIFFSCRFVSFNQLRANYVLHTTWRINTVFCLIVGWTPTFSNKRTYQKRKFATWSSIHAVLNWTRVDSFCA